MEYSNFFSFSFSISPNFNRKSIVQTNIYKVFPKAFAIPTILQIIWTPHSSPGPGSRKSILEQQSWSELFKSTVKLYLKLYFGVMFSACKRDSIFNMKFTVMFALRMLLRSCPLHQAMSPLRGLKRNILLIAYC